MGSEGVERTVAGLVTIGKIKSGQRAEISVQNFTTKAIPSP